MDRCWLRKLEKLAVMAAQSDSSFVIQAKTAYQSTGFMEDFIAGGVLVSTSHSKTVDNSTMVGS